LRYFKFIRNAGVIKTMLLAFTWMFVTGYIPMQKSLVHFSSSELLVLSQRFIFMLILCILFDKRDAAIDKIKGLHSMATDMKPVTLKWFIYINFGLLFSINWILKSIGISLLQSLALQMAALAALLTYFSSLRNRGYIFYYFVVDGLMFLSALLTTLASI